MSNLILIILGIVIIAGVCLFAYRNNKAKADKLADELTQAAKKAQDATKKL